MSKIENTVKKKLSIIVFIWSALLFFLNLQYNFLDEYDIVIFWLAVVLMFGTVIYQIFLLKNYSFVLFEIFIIYLLLHLVYIVGYYGLHESDSYIDYNFLKIILNDNNFVLGQEVVGWHVDGWPMIHIFSSNIALVTNIDPFLIAKFLPALISSIIVIPIYLLIYNIYKSKKVALFSCLLFGTIPQFMNFEAAFVRETFALFIMILFFYILYVSKRRGEYRLTLLLIILIPVIVFAHHFTSFMVIILLSIYIIVSKIITYLYRKKADIKRRLSGIINIKIIFLVVLIAVISYWVYHTVYVLEYSLDVFYEIFGFAGSGITYAEQIQLAAPIVTLRGNILLYGFFIFHILFSFILLIKLLMKKNNQKIEDASFTIFFFFCMFYAFLALYASSSLLFPDRFLPFAWMFGIIPLTGFILIMKKDICKKILVVLLISFIVFNLYNIDPEYYTGNASIKGAVATEKEYLIAEHIAFPEVSPEKTKNIFSLEITVVTNAKSQKEGIELLRLIGFPIKS